MTKAAFHFSVGRDPVTRNWALILLIDADLRLSEPGEQALALLRFELIRVPWRRSADRWDRIRTIHRWLRVVRWDWPEIAARRRARFGDAFA